MAAKKKSGVVEWTIENFSCWNRELHGERLVSPKFNFSAKFNVFPHGFEKERTDMVVQVERTSLKRDPWPGELFWLRSFDRKILHIQKVNREASDGKTTPPTFEKVVSQIREHEDRLTLRYKFENAKNFKESMCTVIEVTDVTFEMDTDSILGGGIKSDIDYSRAIKPAVLYLRSSFVPPKDKVAELTLEMSERKRIKKCFVRSCVRFAEDETFLERHEEHLFCDPTPWVVMRTGERCTHVLLRLRIADGVLTKKHFLRLSNYGGTKARYSVCFAEGKSSMSLDDSSMTIDWIADSYDLRLRCGNFSFPVHKAFLSAQSPLFKTRLSKDADSETLDITDLGPSTLLLFLTHLYTGIAGDLQYDSALKLLSVADEYQVPTLKTECDRFFSDINKCESGSPPPGGNREETGAEESSVCSSEGTSSTSRRDSLMTIDWLADSYDLQLRCGDILFSVHKTVLSAQSPLFKTRLSSVEIKTLDVGDLDPSTLRLFLTYLYTGTLRDLGNDSALKLYHAAERYEVTSLKRNMRSSPQMMALLGTTRSNLPGKLEPNLTCYN